MFEFVLVCLFAFRVTRLLIDDEITQPVRDRLPQYAFLSCVWCLGFWVAVVSTAAIFPFVDIPLPLLWPWGVSAVVAMLYQYFG